MAKTFAGAKQRQSHSDRNDPRGATTDCIAARRVLRDCHAAIKEMQEARAGTSWRLRWVTAITLLRVVGHVQKKVDGARSEFLATAIEDVWSRVRTDSGNEIFHDFIDRERNTILKEYDTTQRRVDSLQETDAQTVGILVGTRIIKPIDALNEAIIWWEVVLGQVEDQAQSARMMARKR